MKHWSISDNQLLRALRSAFSPLSREVAFMAGFDGGIAIRVRETLLGLWLASGRDTFAFAPATHAVTPLSAVHTSEVIQATEELLAAAGIVELAPACESTGRCRGALSA